MKFKMGIITFSLLCCSAGCMADSDIDAKQREALRLHWLDSTVSPGEDYYSYANGAWQKNNPIPAEYASWDSFNILNVKIQDIIHQMLIKASQNTDAKQGSIEQKVGDFYYSGMDEKTINQLGVAPIQPEFDRINAIKSLDDLQKELVHLHLIGVDALFGFGSMQDYKNSTLMIGAAYQGGLGLPERDYYLSDNPKFKKIREAYLNHLEKMFQLLGDSPKTAAQEAKSVMEVETQLAKISMPIIERRNPNAIYHIKTLTELQQITPDFSWENYLKAIGQDQLTQINLAMPDYFKGLNHLLKSISVDEWKIYLRWHLIDAFASYLSTPFVDQNFKMLSALTGIEKLLPRWKRVVSTENGALGFAIGKMYVEQHFPPKAKAQVEEILMNIRSVLRHDLSSLAWMSPETRKEALTKLDLMQQRIGYPIQWRDYSKLKVDRGPYVLNVIRANQFLVNRDLEKIGKPIDQTEWEMTPQTINAYYDVSMNSINMPAGILQAPFFDPDAPAAVNYGAIGFVMGHEITHGFDDQGAQFDGYGNLNNWWKPEDLSQFKKATQCIADQFSNYVVDGNLHVQGKLVVGEAAADLGGLTLAYKAFLQSRDYKNAKTIDGITPEQQFFLGAAHVWAKNIRPQQLQNQITTDPHPPAQYRVNGSFANMPEFQSAYKLTNSSPMVNKNRCVIW
ncbi:M13 family metallopeptidase [Legionella worsleiensis]|uniref:Metallopeptidase PepO, peptidase, M13 family n=1 Tax=Legionella worsleiensis TaxID=45076 RepID=A0A0W1A9H9_9GAMM|nr:metallopeptidase PepO, peptidase, M13 family [Legionella worsleiensis]STY31618.1 metallopeptidase PepO, peptidase, M13 family [Legionella worsleiensis]